MDFKARPSELTQMKDFSWDQGGKLHLLWVVFEMALHCVDQAGLELLNSASASQVARIAEFGVWCHGASARQEDQEFKVILDYIAELVVR